ncbi:hypothetical protein CAPTEDRAFT_225617 [Capitella teleta]|uniref:Uncharacterized protein n=1 Tax=Capitella teleta TaxID=283909 RepID=R7TU96_CAPTE|nr:hypothetical protein CAPTEDRAFT_225617 [Capitella teleta]|eukprot:ELT95036.1 hypothetical protein CAPTEDRAFT_225617 [Capitella teleta]
MNMLHCCLATLLFCCVWTSVAHAGTTMEHTAYLERLLQCLEKVVAYYKQNYADMNLDGIYGLRVLEGQLSVILEQLKHPADVIQRLSALHQDCSAICMAALLSLQRSDPIYLSRLRPLVEAPMTFHQPYARLDQSLRWSGPNIHVADLKEEFSDGCMAEIIGTAGHSKCSLSAECTERMLSRGLKGYSLMHQLLYTILAEQNGCPLPVDALALRASMCADSFYEMAIALQTVHGNIIPVIQDLFLEEEYVCPVLGFMEFLHNDWLRQILSWQRPSGCFGSMPKSQMVEEPVADYDYEVEAVPVPHEQVTKHRTRRGFDLPLNRDKPAKQETFYQKVQPPLKHQLSSQWSKRRLLEEKALKDGCLSHKTAVALGALSQYLRFMLVPGDPNLNLGGSNLIMQADVPVKNTNSFVSKRRSSNQGEAKESEETRVDYGGGEINLRERNYGVESAVPSLQQEEEQYSYYGNEEKASEPVEEGTPPSPIQPSVFHSAYFISIVISIAILMLMFRCVRHRRILIRYRHS